MVSLQLATRAKFPTRYFKTSQLVHQADGQTQLEVCGEVQVTLTRDNLLFKLHAVVVTKLDCDILAGMPFLKDHGIVLDIPKNVIHVGEHHTIPCEGKKKSHTTHQEELLRCENDRMIHPGETCVFKVSSFPSGSEVSIEPHSSNDFSRNTWPPPMFAQVVDGVVSIPNDLDSMVVLKKHQHIAVVRSVKVINDGDQPSQTSILKASTTTPNHSLTPVVTGPYSSNITIDPDAQLTGEQRESFVNIHLKYDSVFDPAVGQYNDNSGRLRASVNIGRVEPPTVKARLPDYDDETMNRLQIKCDELEEAKVLAKPEDLGITVEHVNPSFLVTKPDGTDRYVTSFMGLAAYAKPPPSRVTTCESVLRFLAKWKYVIKTDMTKQFYQMLLKRSSMKYCGVVTPYKGIRVYTRAVMGLPGSSEHLDELTSRVFGDIIHEGSAAKIADDLYVGADTVDGLLSAWERVLQKFQDNNLRLSARKTVVCPVSCTILGWQWSQGSVYPSPHKLNPLSTATPPTTVKGLRSWIGAVKHLKPCIPSYSSLLAPLETAVGGKESRDHLVWTDDLTSSFETAKAALHKLKPIYYAKPTDQLVITTDGACKNGGIGAVLFIIRDGQTKLGGYFSIKMKSFQLNWLPCEQEALAITASINHWKVFIKNSKLKTQILTDSKPCVQAFIKLTRGEFSQSNRIVTFLSALSMYNLTLQHISGSTNELSDYLSRNPSECDLSHDRCQICSFVKELITATVMSVTVAEVLDRKVNMPFVSPAAWKATQRDCPDLRRAYAMLTQGTKPSHKQVKSKDTRSYRNIATINADGLLVVKKEIPYLGTQNLIVIPRTVLPGLLTALHLRLSHPSKTQLSKVFHRHFYGLDAEKHIETVTTECTHCASLKTLPQDLPEFSTSYPPTAPGFKFASDVLRRARQKILVTRDTFSSFTKTCLIDGEDKDSLRTAIIETTSDLRVSEGSSIRVDGGTAFQSLVNDRTLDKLGITIDVGRLKNKNKNPIAEKAVKELETELRIRHPDGGTVSKSDLCTATHILNSRIRSRGLSAREIVYQRSQNTGQQLKMDDTELASAQFDQRKDNHGPSARSKVPRGRTCTGNLFKPGDLVYAKPDGSKHCCRERYMITSSDDNFVYARKFIGNQFRLKQYSFKSSELYKVPSASFDPPRVYGNIKDQSDESSSDESSHDNENPYFEYADERQSSSNHEIPSETDEIQLENSACAPVVAPGNLSDLDLPIAHRKPVRSVTKPKNMRDPNFVYPKLSKTKSRRK